MNGSSDRAFAGGAGNVARLLRPRSIAVIGASGREGAFGDRLLNAILTGRYTGKVYPVNPGYQELQGLRCYPSVAALPEIPDLAAFAVSDAASEKALEEMAAAGVPAAALFGRGYEMPRDGHPSLVERLSRIARGAGMAVCGNNCMGFINAVDGLKISGNPPPLAEKPGVVGLVSHSGSTWSGLMGNQRQLDFSYAISAGAEIATTVADYLDFLLDQPETRVVACILETVRDPERFVAALEKADKRGIPIVALKLGRSEQGRRFAVAHSGALAGSHAAFLALCERHNVITVDTVDALCDTAELMSGVRRPTADGIGIVTDSGGERELIVDIAADLGTPLATLAPETEDRLRGVLDPGMVPLNPVDSYGDGRMLMGECLAVVVTDPNVGLAAMATNLVSGRPYLYAATAALEKVRTGTDKPVLVFGNLHSAISREEAARLRQLGIPVLMGTTTALQAMGAMIAWDRARRERQPLPSPVDDAVRDEATALLERHAAGPLPAEAAFHILELFGVPVAASAFVATRDSAVEAALRLGLPVALKTAEPSIAHKTEAGGVALGLADRDAVAGAYDRIAAACGSRVQVQALAAPGTEILLGMTNDPDFGPLVTVGVGGIFTEIYKDAVSFLPPIRRDDAAARLDRLRGAALLRGARGNKPADLDALAVAVERFSLLCVAIGCRFSEIDVNPVIAGPEGAVAVDALMVLKERNP